MRGKYRCFAVGGGGGEYFVCEGWGENIVPRPKYSILSACVIRVPKAVTQAANTQVALTLDDFEVHVRKNIIFYRQETTSMKRSRLEKGIFPTIRTT